MYAFTRKLILNYKSKLIIAQFIYLPCIQTRRAAQIGNTRIIYVRLLTKSIEQPYSEALNRQQPKLIGSGKCLAKLIAPSHPGSDRFRLAGGWAFAFLPAAFLRLLATYQDVIIDGLRDQPKAQTKSQKGPSPVSLSLHQCAYDAKSSPRPAELCLAEHEPTRWIWVLWFSVTRLYGPDVQAARITPLDQAGERAFSLCSSVRFHQMDASLRRKVLITMQFSLITREPNQSCTDSACFVL